MCNIINMSGELSNPTANLNSAEIDQETKDKLRGDLIGSTSYSESFIVKTLLQLNDLTWNKDLEDDLCFLWDATMECEICDYLYEASFHDIVCSVLESTEENRLLEILVGILANILSNGTTRKIPNNSVAKILQLIQSDDPLLLVQVMRFLKSVAYEKERLEFLTGDIIGQLDFILVNSTNCDLLMVTLDTLAKITSDNKTSINILKGELVNSSLTAYDTILTQENNRNDSDEVYESTMVSSSNNYWMQLLVNLVSTDNNQLLNDIKKYNNKITNTFLNTLKEYTCNTDFITTFTENLDFILSSLNYICPILQIKCVPRDFIDLIIIRNKLDDFEDDWLGDLNELLCYFVSIVNTDLFLREMNSENDFKLHKNVVKYVLNSLSKFEESEYCYLDNLNYLLDQIVFEDA